VFATLIYSIADIFALVLLTRFTAQDPIWYKVIVLIGYRLMILIYSFLSMELVELLIASLNHKASVNILFAKRLLSLNLCTLLAWRLLFAFYSLLFSCTCCFWHRFFMINSVCTN
jgi:hypothetical protein